MATAQRRASRGWRARRPGYVPEAPGPRSCSTCGADISHRGNRAKRCESCAETARRESRPAVAKRYRERHPTTSPSGWHRAKPNADRRDYFAAYRRRKLVERRVAARAWRAANPETLRRYRHEQREARRDAQHRRRARKAALPWEPIVYRHLAVRDHWTCGLCHEPVDPALVHPDSMSGSVDHVVPISKGGAHLYTNVQLAHLACNLAKGDRVG